MLTITVLAENSDGEGLCGEHGLALHIEYEGRRYLLDAGATGLFAENAAKLGLPLAELEAAGTAAQVDAQLRAAYQEGVEQNG